MPWSVYPSVVRRRNDLFANLIRYVAALALAVGAPAFAQFTARTEEAVDPLTIDDDDFARVRDPAVWQGLQVRRISFVEGMASWRIFRIANLRRPAGPLWMIPHDNENASFAAGLEAVRSWGGVMIAVDTGPRDGYYDARFNGAVAGGEVIDPNRNFYEAFPVYIGTLLADLPAGDAVGGGRPIIALHINAFGFDPSLARCGPPGTGGSGEISVALCDAKHLPRRATTMRWPFDDDDTLALTPYAIGGDATTGFCARRMMARDFNLVFESVGISDGSLSNYALYHGLRYINLETRDRGDDPAGIAAARGRLLAMIDTVMAECVAMPRVELRMRRR